MFTEQYWQQKINYLIQLHNKNKMPQQLLFVSKKPEKILLFSLVVAKIILCLEPLFTLECHCLNCEKVNNNSYFDLTILGDFATSIKKEEILNLINNKSYTSLESKLSKIYIIKEINLLTLESANSLLKFLEEPPANTFAILLTSNVKQVLTTIKSRCLIMNFNDEPELPLAEKKINLLAQEFVNNLEKNPELNYLWVEDVKKFEKKEKKIILNDIVVLLEEKICFNLLLLNIINSTVTLITKLDENLNEDLLWQDYIISTIEE